MLKIKPNKKDIGAEIVVNLKEITNKDTLKIKSALNKYGMVYFKQQKLTSKLYIKFAKYFVTFLFFLVNATLGTRKEMCLK